MMKMQKIVPQKVRVQPCPLCSEEHIIAVDVVLSEMVGVMFFASFDTTNYVSHAVNCPKQNKPFAIQVPVTTKTGQSVVEVRDGQ